MLEGSNHHYEPIQMTALPGKTRELPLRGRVSPMPRTAQAQPAQKIGAEAKGGEAKVVARAGFLEIHPICGKLKAIIRSFAQVQ
jgi:hypothetical protein